MSRASVGAVSAARTSFAELGAVVMHSRFVRPLRFGLVGLALLAVPLYGCTASSFGLSSHGNSKLAAVEISNIADYTAEGALREARAHFRNNDFGYSASFYKRVVELSPKDPQGYVGLGASYDRLRRFDLSDRVYEALFKLTGGTAQYFNNVGYSYMLRGNLTAALTSFRKARAIDPDNMVVANNLQILSNAVAGSRRS
jgi:Flp pilus assembly protein TadD